MTDEITTQVLNYCLILTDQRSESGQDLWAVRDSNYHGPTELLPIAEWPDVLRQYEIDQQKAAGFTVWNIRDDRPKYWEKWDAVYRSGKEKSDPNYHRDPTHSVHMRNGVNDPKSLISAPRGFICMDTPEVSAAIEAARKAHAEAIEAAERFREAKKRIPTMTESKWMALPDLREVDG